MILISVVFSKLKLSTQEAFLGYNCDLSNARDGYARTSCFARFFAQQFCMSTSAKHHQYLGLMRQLLFLITGYTYRTTRNILVKLVVLPACRLLPPQPITGPFTRSAASLRSPGTASWGSSSLCSCEQSWYAYPSFMLSWDLADKKGLEAPTDINTATNVLQSLFLHLQN